jgi:chromosome segregation ATPase
MEAKIIEKELKRLEARRETLASDVEAACRKLDAARAGLVAGQVKVADVTAAQGTHTTLVEAVTALDQTITETRARHSAALADEQRVADASRAGEIGEEKTRITGELQGILEMANRELTEAVAAYMQRASRFGELSREEDAIRQRLSGTDYRRGASQDLRLKPVLPYGEAVWTALRIEQTRIHNEHLNDIRRRDAARRRARELAARGDEPRAVPSVYSQTEAARTGFYVQPDTPEA